MSGISPISALLARIITPCEQNIFGRLHVTTAGISAKILSVNIYLNHNVASAAVRSKAIIISLFIARPLSMHYNNYVSLSVCLLPVSENVH